MTDVTVKKVSIDITDDDAKMTISFQGFEDLEQCRKFSEAIRSATQKFGAQSEITDFQQEKA
jgi:hypothetical protein